jgi:hypothetical protein
VSTIHHTTDDKGFQELVALAEQRQCTVGELIVALVSEQGAAPPPLPPFVGLFANEPELMDQVMEDVYRTRETQQLREGNDG